MAKQSAEGEDVGGGLIRQQIQSTILDWVKTQGTWCVITIALVAWSKPYADKFLESHFHLVETIETEQVSNRKLLEEIHKLVEKTNTFLEQQKIILQSLPNDSQATLAAPPEPQA